MFSLTEGYYGFAEPAIEGDELDVTLHKTTPPTPPRFEAPGTTAEKAGLASEGLTVFQKVLCLGIVVAVCVAFVKTRDSNRAAGQFRQKSLA
jgi:hypothetical protein